MTFRPSRRTVTASGRAPLQSAACLPGQRSAITRSVSALTSPERRSTASSLSPTWSLPCAGKPASTVATFVVGVWSRFPFMMITVLAALSSIPDDVTEAAAIDGANRFQVFRHVTFPLILTL